MKIDMKNQSGQVVLILILVMTVALGIGISVVQRSLSDVSTASKIEQSSRAFSAAEAGIEKAIQSGTGFTNPISLGNNASIAEVQASPIPAAEHALEYPPISKEEMAHVWLANADNLSAVYNQSSFNIYFGIPDTTDKPAVAVTVISWDGRNYVSTKRFFDSDSGRTSSNGFTPATCTNPTVLTNNNTSGSESRFYCSGPVTGYPYDDPAALYSSTAKPILVRIRLLYSSTSQPVAVAPNTGFSLPFQANIYTATGVSGETQRKVQVFRLDKVVPSFLDYAIFSAGEINK